MSATHVVVEGTLKPDGPPEVAETFGLPPGRVQVMVEVLGESASSGEVWFEYPQQARAERESAAAEINTRHDEHQPWRRTLRSAGRLVPLPTRTPRVCHEDDPRHL